MKTHKFAEAIPEMTPSEYSELKEDIKVNGQRIPIILFEGQILDGRNRYRALKELKKEPKTSTFKGSEVEAASLVISLNIKRRHLTTGQRSIIGIETLLPAMKEEAQKRKGGDRVSEKVKKTSEPKNRLTARSDKKATAKVAKEVGVSRAAIEQAVRVKEKATPQVKKAVQEGKMSLGAAVKTLAPVVEKNKTKSDKIADILSLRVLGGEGRRTFARVAFLYNHSSNGERQEMKDHFKTFFTELDKVEEEFLPA